MGEYERGIEKEVKDKIDKYLAAEILKRQNIFKDYLSKASAAAKGKGKPPEMDFDMVANSVEIILLDKTKREVKFL